MTTPTATHATGIPNQPTPRSKPPQLRTAGLHCPLTNAPLGARKFGAPPITFTPPTQIRIGPGTQHGTYTGHELGSNTPRPGATDALEIPSRVGRHLHYRDGRVELAAQEST